MLVLVHRGDIDAVIITQQYRYENADYQRHRKNGASHDEAVRLAKADITWKWRRLFEPLDNRLRIQKYWERKRAA